MRSPLESIDTVRIDRRPSRGPLARAAPAMLLALTASACVVSVNPAVSESEATFDARLLGTWVNGSDTAEVTRDAGNTYAIRYVSDRRTGHFAARLGRLGDRTVLDLWPGTGERDSDNAPWQFTLAIPGHLLLVLRITADSIVATGFEPDSLRAALDAGRLRLAHSGDENQVVLQGTTRQLRAALGPFVARGAPMGEPATWHRPAAAADPDAVAAAARGRPPEVPCFEAAAWREADRLFHRDPHWLGADGASSVDLGGGRTLWLFDDSWIDASGTGSRRGARMVSNSVAIQTGTDPSTATIAFYWGRTPDGAPAAFFPDTGNVVLWPGHGIRLGDRLLVFVAPTIRTGGEGLAFRSAGWGALLVENPDDAPSAWRVRTLATPPNPLGIVLGSVEVLRLGNAVYALGSQDPVKSHPVFAARWAVEAARGGDLARPEWYAGQPDGWVPDTARAPRWPLFENGQSELSLIRDPVSRQFLAVQTVGFGAADVAMRAARVLTGPWTAPRMIYRPPEHDRPNVMIYAAKAHPQLTGADLVLTYATNAFRFAGQADSLIYYPRFVRLTRCE